MSKGEQTSKYSRGERIALVVFWISSGLYLLNILVGKASILWDWQIFRLNDVGEFLMLLVASVSIISVALHREGGEAKQSDSNIQ